MIDLPLSKIKENILEETDLSEDALDEKIEEKLEQLSGLISEQGAAHIIANDLGVQLVESSGRLQIENIVEGLRDVEIAGKVADVYEINEFDRDDGSTGRVGSFMLADETGRIRVTMWDDQAENLNNLERGDTVKITSGYVRKNRDRPEVHVNENSSLHVNPGDVSVDFDVGEGGTTRKDVQDLEAGEQYVEILATIVQLFDPRFFEVSSDSGERVQEDDPDEETEYSYVTNAFLDDGTDNIRGVFWRQQTQNLLGMDDDDVQEIRDDPSVFEDVKTSLLGKIIKVEGRVEANEDFDRLEFVARKVDTSPDPEEEMQELDDAAQEALDEDVPDTDVEDSGSDEEDDVDEPTGEDESEKAQISKEALEEGMVEEEDFDDDDIPSLDEL